MFLILNFAALGLGSYLMNGGVVSEWYSNLNKAPWTPPGWVFGAAWTSIMICFAIYMAYVLELSQSPKSVIVLYVIQWILNVSWNPVFFDFHLTGFALVLIILLTFLVIYFAFKYYSILGLKSLLILPYAVWLIIATSLNAYAYLYN